MLRPMREIEPYLPAIIARLNSLSLSGVSYTSNDGGSWIDILYSMDLSNLEALRTSEKDQVALIWNNPTLVQLREFVGSCKPYGDGPPTIFKDFIDRNKSLEYLEVTGFPECGKLDWLAPV